MRIEKRNNKDYVFCSWRRKYVRLTPEEYVRQTFLRRLVEEYHYPEALIGVEVAIRVGDLDKRLDAILMDREFHPRMILEFKRETVALTQRVLDQASVYNRAMHVPYILLCNGPETLIARVLDTGYEFLPTIPEWNQL